MGQETGENELDRKRREHERDQNDTSCRDTLLSIVKIVSWLLVVIATLGCLVFSKFSIIVLAKSVRVVDDGLQKTGIILMTLIALMIPAAIGLVRTALIVCHFNDSLKARIACKSILMTILANTAETFGICLLVLEVLSAASSIIGVVIMTGAMVCTTLWHMIQQCQRCVQDKKLRKRLLAMLFFFLVQMVAIALVCIYEYRTDHDAETYTGVRMQNVWKIPLALILISIVWSPKAIEWQLQTYVPRRYSETASNIKSSMAAREKVRSQSGMIGSICKLVMTPLVFVLYLYVFDTIDIRKMFNEWLPKINVSVLQNHEDVFLHFLLNIFTSAGGYFFIWLLCNYQASCEFKLPCIRNGTLLRKVSSQFVPLAVTSLGAALLTIVYRPCSFILSAIICEQISPEETAYGMASVILFLIGNLYAIYWILKNENFVLERESQMFHLPTYNSVLLEQWIWLNYRTSGSSTEVRHPEVYRKHSRIYMCTTMYQEAEDELKELLKSIKNINDNRHEKGPSFECHILFDNAVNTTDVPKFGKFPLILMHLITEVLGISIADVISKRMAYGVQWRIQLAASSRQPESNMYLYVHLKDPFKVKKGKRWSQIMYMSHVVNNPEVNQEMENRYLLVTDADVKFDYQSVEALLDVLLRDDDVGAACGRTHPVLSINPIVGYQVFDYAIAHWLLKAANDVLGTVLCCPGCFTMYRASAVKAVLPEYGSNTNGGWDFLMKDMGEDRWFCTLMISSGVQLEYCAAASNYTNTPTGFAEFYNQRRRWNISTFANTIEMLQNCGQIRHANRNVTVAFLVYQIFLLMSSTIGPTTTLIVLTGGLSYAFNMNTAVGGSIIGFCFIAYLVVCLLFGKDIQIKTAVVLSIAFAVIITVTFFGIAIKIGLEYYKFATEPWPGSFTESALTIPTLYMTAMTGMYVVTALLHPGEWHCLPTGLLYLIGMPCGYLFLTVYSLCNTNDTSWGTRETPASSSRLTGSAGNWFAYFRKTPKETPSEENSQSQEGHRESRPLSDEVTDDVFHQDGTDGGEELNVFLRKRVFSESDTDEPKPFILDYVNKFQRCGFTRKSFLHGLNDRELKDKLKIKDDGHRALMLEEIRKLGSPTNLPVVPVSLSDWLDVVGLPQYKDSIVKKYGDQMRIFVILKDKSEPELHQTLRGMSITPFGHRKRFIAAIRQLGQDSPLEAKLAPIRQQMELQLLSQSSDFWDTLVREKLTPQSVEEEKITNELGDIRRNLLIFFVVSNLLWAGILATVMMKSELQSEKWGTDVLNLVFAVLFAFVTLVQFVAMLFHRSITFLHVMARASCCCCQHGLCEECLGERDTQDDLPRPSAYAQRDHVYEQEVTDDV